MPVLTPAGNSINLVGPANRLHPLNRSLEAWYLCVPGLMGGSRWIDLAQPGPHGNHGYIGIGVTQVMDPATAWHPAHGRPGGWGSIRCDGLNDFVTCGTNPRLATQGALTVAFWLKTSGNLANFDVILGKTNTGTWSAGWLFWSSGSGNVTWAVEGYNSANAVASGLTTTEWLHVIGTWDGATVGIYINGVLAQSTANTRTITSTHELTLGADGGTAFNVNGWLDDVRIYSRALGADEAGRLYQETKRGYPCALNRLWTPPTWEHTAGGAFTLTADAGTYNLTGQTAGLLVGRKVSAASGSYALTGQTVTLRAARILPATSGSYSFTGQTAALAKSRVLSAEAGAFALTGQAAGLRVTRTLGAGAGSFVLTGQAAGVLAGRRLTAGSGTFVFTGGAAGLLRGFSLAAGSGAFSLTGQTAGVRATRKLTANAGSYALTGQDVTFTTVLPTRTVLTVSRRGSGVRTQRILE